MIVKETVYGEPTKNILATPDHYVAIAMRVNQQLGVSTYENDKYIIKSGALYPANDATAIGVVLGDYDVTDTERNASVIIHGFIQTSKLPEEPSEEAKQALKQISFL